MGARPAGIAKIDRRIELGLIEKKRPRASLEIHQDAGMFRQEAAEPRQQPLRCKRRDDGEIDGQSPSLMGHHGQGIALDRIELHGNLPAVHHPGFGKPDALARAPEKLHAQKILETADLPANGALRKR